MTDINQAMLSKKSNLSAIFIRQQDDKLNQELEQLKAKKKEIKNFPDFGSSTDDSAQEVTEFSTDKSLIFNINKKIKEINAALKAISNGTYGICSNCGERIMAGRLEIMPEAITCPTCNSNQK
ncbi:MAG: DnaK suppressor protein [Berkelbacteria bacterium GW2011_GWA2_38_9]|uniref:DnaK suppressor protein n=1 Tax=Berkelbacteria bacterium GW2011_GWA2_38_9 TaxID=1618334 RepID=A0A0G0NMS8_9BACT|nr:MAG: DnaK suppressor protein [Berkelbacteria bacterium GW2011_GWA2_38_9]